MIAKATTPSDRKLFSFLVFTLTYIIMFLCFFLKSFRDDLVFCFTVSLDAVGFFGLQKQSQVKSVYLYFLELL